MEVHFKIGEIADMFDISVRALHLYDKMGLFKPEYTDETSGYRYYTADQIDKLQTILNFKKIGFSLNEIKTLFDHQLDQLKLLSMLNQKADYFQKQIDIAAFNIDNINRMIKAVEEATGITGSNKLSDEEKAVRMAKIVCLENIKLENLFSEILWL